jgi:hypothetical protein
VEADRGGEKETVIRRLWTWCDKLLDLSLLIHALPGNGFSRRFNESLLTTILLTGCFMRLRSLNAFELSFHCNAAWAKFIPRESLPSADTLARGLEKSDIAGLRSIAFEVNHNLRRAKAFNTREVSHGLMVAAVDGHETFATEHRCCDMCLTRKKKSATKRSSNTSIATWSAR